MTENNNLDKLLGYSIVFLGISIVAYNRSPILASLLRFISLYGLFVWVNTLGNVRFDKIIMVLIFGVVLVTCVSIFGSAWVSSSVWGGVGMDLDGLIEAIIKLLTWLNENGFLRSSDSGMSI